MNKQERLAEIKLNFSRGYSPIISEQQWLIETLEREMERSNKLRGAIIPAGNRAIVDIQALEAFDKRSAE